jgi:hypothetical protein
MWHAYRVIGSAWVVALTCQLMSLMARYLQICAMVEFFDGPMDLYSLGSAGTSAVLNITRKLPKNDLYSLTSKCCALERTHRFVHR